MLKSFFRIVWLFLNLFSSSSSFIFTNSRNKLVAPFIAKISDFENITRADLIFNLITKDIDSEVDKKFIYLVDSLNLKIEKQFDVLRNTMEQIQIQQAEIRDSISPLKNINLQLVFGGGSVGTVLLMYLMEKLK